jgi:hypothetical protein
MKGASRGGNCGISVRRDHVGFVPVIVTILWFGPAAGMQQLERSTEHQTNSRGYCFCTNLIPYSFGSAENEHDGPGENWINEIVFIFCLPDHQISPLTHPLIPPPLTPSIPLPIKNLQTPLRRRYNIQRLNTHSILLT